MEAETALWAWLLFSSGLPTLRVKELLLRWQNAGISPLEALRKLPAGAAALGVTSNEALRLTAGFRGQSPTAAPRLPALTWIDPGYPRGLLALPLRQRPALLTYLGDPALLDRPIIYFPPADIDLEAQEAAREAISLLLGEIALLGAYEGSPQATLLLEEMAAAEGEALLFARSGLGSSPETAAEGDPRISERRLIVSPLPPGTAYQAAWTPLLQRVALAAADRIVLTGAVDVPPDVEPDEVRKPFVALPGAALRAADPVRAAANVLRVRTPTDLLDWLAGDVPLPSAIAGEAAGQGDVEPVLGLGQEDVGPPLSTDDILTTLRRGGNIPEALRRRLLGEE